MCEKNELTLPVLPLTNPFFPRRKAMRKAQLEVAHRLAGEHFDCAHGAPTTIKGALPSFALRVGAETKATCLTVGDAGLAAVLAWHRHAHDAALRLRQLAQWAPPAERHCMVLNLDDNRGIVR